MRQYACTFQQKRSTTIETRWRKSTRSTSAMKIEAVPIPCAVTWKTPSRRLLRRTRAISPSTEEAARLARLSRVSGATERAVRSALPLRCTRCGGALAAEAGELRCADCRQLYDEPLPGILDLRLSYADPQLSRDEDERLAAELANQAPEHDLGGLLDLHWRLVGKQPELAARFTAQELSAAAKTTEIVDAIEGARGAAMTRQEDRKSTRLNSSHLGISYAV